MSKLLLVLPDDKRGQSEFNKSTYIALNDIQNWSNSVNNTQLVSIKTTLNNSTTSNTYIPIPKMAANFNSISANAMIIFNLVLNGEGTIGLQVNGQIINERYFNLNASTNTVPFMGSVTLKSGSNNVALVYKAISGTVVITNENTLQVLNSN